MHFSLHFLQTLLLWSLRHCSHQLPQEFLVHRTAELPSQPETESASLVPLSDSVGKIFAQRKIKRKIFHILMILFTDLDATHGEETYDQVDDLINVDGAPTILQIRSYWMIPSTTIFTSSNTLKIQVSLASGSVKLVQLMAMIYSPKSMKPLQKNRTKVRKGWNISRTFRLRQRPGRVTPRWFPHPAAPCSSLETDL